MSGPTIYCVGPHAYKIEHEDGGRPTVSMMGKGEVVLWYCLFHANGYCPTDRPGEPNAHEWKRSSRHFPCTLPGVAHAIDYAQRLLRGQHEEND